MHLAETNKGEENKKRLKCDKKKTVGMVIIRLV